MNVPSVAEPRHTGEYEAKREDMATEIRRLKEENANIRMINERIGRDNGSLREENAQLIAALKKLSDSNSYSVVQYDDEDPIIEFYSDKFAMSPWHFAKKELDKWTLR